MLTILHTGTRSLKAWKLIVLTCGFFKERKIVLFGAVVAHFPDSYCHYLQQIVKTITKDEGHGYENLQK